MEFLLEQDVPSAYLAQKRNILEEGGRKPMSEEIKRMICCLQKMEDIDMLDINLVKKYALNRKMYELIVFVNANLTEYIEFVKKEKNRA